MDPILEILKFSAKSSPKEMAQLTSLPQSEVESRIAEFEKNGTILGYQTLIDDEKAGNELVSALIEVKITPERGGGFDRYAKRIAQFEQVLSCYLMSGGYDLLVLVQGRNLREVAQFVAEKLATIEGVLSTSTHFRLKAYKENGVLLAREDPVSRLPVSP